MVMLAAWWGSKPDWKCMMAPLRGQLNQLNDTGLIIQDHLNQNVLVTLRMLTATADNPAKESMLNYQSNRCGVCQQERKPANLPPRPWFLTPSLPLICTQL